ncbi:MAG: hypothetical protein Kow0062_06110 [Acidobacteriota bacterium]|nr:MAG: YraN family protein [Acidobacteriota bacterium]
MDRTERRHARARAGREAEDLACRWLAAQGWEILARNARIGRDELDIVARDGATVVFVEVRSRRADSALVPEATLDRGKRERLIRAAAGYIARHGLGDRPCRFDLVAVTRSRDGWATLRHHRGVFVDDAI